MEVQVLILNSGSSSLKFQLIRMPEEDTVCKGLVERIGSEQARVSLQYGGQTDVSEQPVPNHREALGRIVEKLLAPEPGILKSPDAITAVGHRVVHGGNRFSETTQIDAAVRREIANLAHLAPLHNPPNLQGIEVAESYFPKALQFAVFDTAFHQTIPLKAKKYAIPSELFEKEGIQVYGFHGTSHKFVSGQLKPLLPEHHRIISLHLGNGCSATAIVDGKSVDHSLGFTPSNGLIMGSRAGDIDQGVIFHLVTHLGYSLERVTQMLNSESGMLGLTGYSDLRDIQKAAEAGDPDCKLALEMNAYRIKKYIGAYTAAMNGLDGLVFTAGIGEHSSLLRTMVCSEMEYLGIRLDPVKNQNPGKGVQALQAEDSKVSIWVVPTNEELQIAREVFERL